MDAGQFPNLETFAKAAELSCFTAAARALGVTQATVSQQVQALEKDLGVSLFHRRGGLGARPVRGLGPAVGLAHTSSNPAPRPNPRAAAPRRSEVFQD